MHVTTRWLRLIPLLAALAAGPSWGQQTPATPAAAKPATPTAPGSPTTPTSAATPVAPTPQTRDVPRPDQLEPGVDTSATPADAAAGNATPGTQKSGGVASGNATSGSVVPGNARSGSVVPGSAKSGSVAPKGVAPESATSGTADKGGATGAPIKSAAAGKGQDRLELDATQITGNRELPKVLYIVPWKRSDLGDLIGKPANSLLDEVLAPVDRDVFKRENRYYDALKPDQNGGSAPPAAGASGTVSPSGAVAAPDGHK